MKSIISRQGLSDAPRPKFEAPSQYRCGGRYDGLDKPCTGLLPSERRSEIGPHSLYLPPIPHLQCNAMNGVARLANTSSLIVRCRADPLCAAASAAAPAAAAAAAARRRLHAFDCQLTDTRKHSCTHLHARISSHTYALHVHTYTRARSVHGDAGWQAVRPGQSVRAATWVDAPHAVQSSVPSRPATQLAQCARRRRTFVAREVVFASTDDAAHIRN